MDLLCHLDIPFAILMKGNATGLSMCRTGSSFDLNSWNSTWNSTLSSAWMKLPSGMEELNKHLSWSSKSSYSLLQWLDWIDVIANSVVVVLPRCCFGQYVYTACFMQYFDTVSKCLNVSRASSQIQTEAAAFFRDFCNFYNFVIFVIFVIFIIL